MGQSCGGELELGSKNKNYLALGRKMVWTTSPEVKKVLWAPAGGLSLRHGTSILQPLL